MENIPMADLVVAAVLLLFVLTGAKRGLFKTLASLVVTIAAMIGAGFFGSMAAKPLSAIIYPRIEGKFIESIVAAAGSELDAAGELGTEVLANIDLFVAKLEALGVESSSITGLLNTFEPAEFVSAAAQTIFNALLQGVLTIIFFFLLLIALKILVNTFDLVFKLPVIGTVNTIGGALIGLAEGVLLVFLAVFLLQKCGVALPEMAEGGFVLSFFLSHTPKTLLATLLQQVG